MSCLRYATDCSIGGATDCATDCATTCATVCAVGGSA